MEVFILVSCVGGLLYILFSCIVFSILSSLVASHRYAVAVRSQTMGTDL